MLAVEGLYLGDGLGASQAVEELGISLEGVQGDCHFGFTKRAGAREKRFHSTGTPIWNSRQWSAVSSEELAAISEAMGMVIPLKAEWLGANLLLSECPDLTDLPPMTRLIFPGGAVLLVYGKNLPCAWPVRVMAEEGGVDPGVANRFGEAALRRRGLVGWVERAGTIRPGDEVAVYLPRPATE